MRRVVILAALALAVSPAPAHAGWKLDRAQEIAAHVWGDPCAGHVAIAWGAMPDRFTSAYADVSACRVVFDAGETWSWRWTCTVMLHEYGHLAGYRDPLNVADPIHSHDPRSVMSIAMLGPDRRCAGRGRPYLSKIGWAR